MLFCFLLQWILLQGRQLRALPLCAFLIMSSQRFSVFGDNVSKCTHTLLTQNTLIFNGVVLLTSLLSCSLSSATQKNRIQFTLLLQNHYQFYKQPNIDFCKKIIYTSYIIWKERKMSYDSYSCSYSHFYFCANHTNDSRWLIGECNMIILFVITCIAIIVCLASIIPVCQYIYWTYFQKKTKNISYSFPGQLYDCHIRINSIPHNHYKNLKDLWDMELQYELP